MRTYVNQTIKCLLATDVDDAVAAAAAAAADDDDDDDDDDAAAAADDDNDVVAHAYNRIRSKRRSPNSATRQTSKPAAARRATWRWRCLLCCKRWQGVK